jgi:O-antigen/teichoic acid export membrane protein
VVPRLDSFILLSISATSAGYFAMGERVLGPALLVPVALSISLYPFLSRETGGRRGSRPLSVLLAALGLVLAVIGILLSPTLVPLLFGDQYEKAVGVVQITLLVLPFVFASNPLLAHLYVDGREHLVVRVTVIVSLFGTVLIVAGQLLGGPQLAAVGLVLRQVLILAVLVGIEVGTSREARPHPGGGAPVG